MYHQKMAVAIKHDGKVLREFKDSVLIPFGSEYTILVKNLNSVRAEVRIWVDGIDATEGTALVVPANGEVELERFIKAGNLNKGNKFKFIERTSKIENGPRGIKVDDGLIRVEFQFEKVVKQDPIKDYEEWYKGYKQGRDDERWPLPPPARPPYYWGNQPLIWNGNPGGTSVCGNIATSEVKTGGVLRGMGQSVQAMNCSFSTSDSGSYGSVSPQGMTATSATMTTTDGPAINVNMATGEVSQAFVNDVGVTVPGSVSDQKFHVAAWFPVEVEKHSIVLRMLGKKADKVVAKAVTVKAKQRCVSCGHVNKATNKCCSECGTGLEIVA